MSLTNSPFWFSSGATSADAGGFYPYSIDQSLRLDGSSGYLSKSDFGTATDTSKRTFSTWIKTSNDSGGTYNHIIGGGSSNIDGFGFNPDEKLQYLQGGANIYDGNAALRDVGAWYHIFTTWNATDNEIYIYINGVLDKSFTSSISGLTKIGNTGHTTTIGRRSNVATYIHGYLAETVFLDGTIGDVNDFGELINGVWVPKEIDTSSITFGNNGFYLPFTQDVSSGNSINFGTGRTAKVTYLDSSSYDIGASDDFTIEYFFKTQDVGANYGNWMGHYLTGGPHHLISYDFRSSTRDVYFYSGNGQALKWSVAGDVTLSAGTWHHVVFQRDGTTLRAYIDGTRLTSVSNSSSSWSLSDGKATNFNKAYDLSQIIIGDPHGQGMSGSLSNVRYVIGDTVYADDDSDITVPTATLTAVTGTKLLTAVNATLGDDISTENNDGSVSGATLSYDSPFTTSNFFEDASGNGNDFTPNNLAATDVVPDSPTNNWSTLNPLKVNDKIQTFAEGNLDFSSTQTSTNPAVTSTFAVTTGKWYWEVYIRNDAGSNSVGIAKNPNNLEDDSVALYNSADSYQYQTDGNKRNNSSSTSYGDAWTTGDIIGVALDLDSGDVYFYKNGTIQNSGTAAYTGLSGEFTSYSLVYQSGAQVYNFGQEGTFAGNTAAGGNSDENGVGNFKYSVPSGYLALCSANLPEVTIGPNSTTTSDEYFNTVLYTGDADNDVTVTNTFAADWVWLKIRESSAGTTQHFLQDIVRGFGGSKSLSSSSTGAEGFTGSTQASQNIVTTSSSLQIVSADLAANGKTYVAWTWKAGGTAVSNTDGSITSSVSANQDAGFSICTWTGNGVDGATIGHGLTSPEFSIVKNRDAATNWDVCWVDFSSGTSLNLDTTSAEFSPTQGYQTLGSSTITLNNGGSGITRVNTNNQDYVAYVFKSVDGYSKVGSYIANASAGGPFVYTGFRPAWVITKMITNSSQWTMIDNTRNTYNAVDNGLVANTTAAEVTGSSTATPFVDFTSNGFKIRSDQAQMNQNGDTFIYLAFAEEPFKYANAR